MLGTKLYTQQLTAYCRGQPQDSLTSSQVVRSRGSGRLGDLQEQRGWAVQIASEGTLTAGQLFWGPQLEPLVGSQDVVHLSSTLGRMECGAVKTGRNVTWASS